MMIVVSVEMLRTTVCFIFRRWLDFELYNLTVYVFWNTLCSVSCPWLDLDLRGEILEILYDPYKIDRYHDSGRVRSIFEWKVYRKTVFGWMKIAIKVWFLRIQTDLILSLLSDNSEVRYIFVALSRDLVTSFVVVPVSLFLIHCIFATAVSQLRAHGWPCSGEIAIEFGSWPPLVIQLKAPHWL